MIARLRFYRSFEEAREEWNRFGLPLIAGHPTQLLDHAYFYIDGASESLMESLAGFRDSGVRVFRCRSGVPRLFIEISWERLRSDDSPFDAGLWESIQNAFRNYFTPPAHELKFDRCRIDLSRTAVMGILNVTPDSFSDGGRYLSYNRAVARAEEMADQGADIIDVGGESTRPFSDPVPQDEELRRIIPVIEDLSSTLEVPLSVDTRKPEVARRAIEAGAAMVNDVSGLRDSEMIRAVAEMGIPVVIMHMLGEPKTMQLNIHYEDVVGDIILYLHDRIEAALAMGVREENIIVDPGIGFGKELIHNLEIIRRLREFTALNRPVLVGPSRKTFIGRILGVPLDQRMEGTIAAVVASVLNGASIVRVHDVKETVRACRIADAINSREHSLDRVLRR